MLYHMAITGKLTAFLQIISNEDMADGSKTPLFQNACTTYITYIIYILPMVVVVGAHNIYITNGSCGIYITTIYITNGSCGRCT